jgi:hypothetical protein
MQLFVPADSRSGLFARIPVRFLRASTAAAAAVAVPMADVSAGTDVAVTANRAPTTSRVRSHGKALGSVFPPHISLSMPAGGRTNARLFLFVSFPSKLLGGGGGEPKWLLRLRSVRPRPKGSVRLMTAIPTTRQDRLVRPRAVGRLPPPARPSLVLLGRGL